MFRISIIFIIVQIISLFVSNAQIQNKNIKPMSFQYISDSNPLTNETNIEEIKILKFNKDSLNKYDDSVSKINTNAPYRFGIAIDSKINLDNSGTWDNLDNGDRLWRLKIKCEDAVSINLIYSNFYLPDGTYFFIYNSTKKYVLGAFSKYNNKSHHKFSTDLVPGDICYLEYYEPKNVGGQGIIEISKVIYGYIDLLGYKETEITKKGMNNEELLSAECERNVNCSEGDAFCREKYSVSRILLSDNSALCTGSLINNVKQDYIPYFLTANHCINSEWDDPNVWIFEFGYMYTYCNGESPKETYSYSGADIRANWANSDFALLELQEQPQSGENNFNDVFFNGWDRSGNVPNSVVGIHHPSGDYMKISVSNEPPDIVDNDTHWDVDWTTGTTEGGSSGSPLYNPNKQVIGQVHYGTYPPGHLYEYCHPDKRTAYGMFSVSWFGDGTDETSLHHWLDPDDPTGVNSPQTLDGIKMPLLKYGWNITNGQTINWNAYDVIKIGSSQYAPFTVYNGGNLTLKAGREIVIRPCTKIVAGSTFRGYIQALDCSDIVNFSQKESEYRDNVCGTYPPKASAEDINSNSIEPLFNKLVIIPNPFTDETKISIYLSQKVMASLEVYDILGNRVVVLSNGEMLSQGTHDFNLSSSNMNSGVFYTVLTTPTERLTKKLILIK
jgi:hypothetical protein